MMAGVKAWIIISINIVASNIPTAAYINLVYAIYTEHSTAPSSIAFQQYPTPTEHSNSNLHALEFM